jgi:hypothetical protein
MEFDGTYYYPNHIHCLQLAAWLLPISTFLGYISGSLQMKATTGEIHPKL